MSFPPMFSYSLMFSFQTGRRRVSGFIPPGAAIGQKGCAYFIGLHCLRNRTLIYVDTLTPPRNFRSKYHTYHENQQLSSAFYARGWPVVGRIHRPGRTHPADCRTGGFALGCQAWTFREFTVLDAIDKTAAAGGKVIELYSGQKFSPEKPGVVFDHNASDEIIAEVNARLQKDGIRAVNYGVVPIPNNEAEARKIFDFAKKLGLYGITTESVESIDLIEKLVKEYDIRVGFHDHQRRRMTRAIKCGIPTTF